MLVISSCTDSKLFEPENRLVLEDFKDPPTLKRRTRELSRYTRPAGQMYTGQHHIWVMEGVRLMRERFGEDAVSMGIVSAGYGLIDESTPIVPYDVTFHGKSKSWIKARARELGIPGAIRNAASGFQLVLFLLGVEYLLAMDAPMPPASSQRFVYLASSSSSAELLASGASVVLVGLPETSKYRAPNTSLKGKMFLLLARALSRRGNPLLEALYADASADTILRVLDEEVTNGPS